MTAQEYPMSTLGKMKLDDFLLDCPEISQEEREEIMEFVGGEQPVLSYSKDSIIALVRSCGGNKEAETFLMENLDDVIQWIQNSNFLHERLDEEIRADIWRCLEHMRGI